MPKSIDYDEVQRLIAEGNAQLVEVLRAREFGEEHITGAINIRLKSSTSAPRSNSSAGGR